MDILVENTQYGLVVSSRVLAEQLGKRHSDVLRALTEILTNANLRSLIITSNYNDKKGEERKEYLLTKDGFTLYMFNIQGYQDFKLAYINRFNEMERELKVVKNESMLDYMANQISDDEVLKYITRIKKLEDVTARYLANLKVAYSELAIYCLNKADDLKGLPIESDKVNIVIDPYTNHRRVERCLLTKE